MFSERKNRSRSGRFLAFVAVVVAAAGASLALAVPALAGKPTGEFKNFTLCPLKNVKVEECLYALTGSGEVKLGNQAVPIENAITLQGGDYFNSSTNEDVFVNAEGGSTLSKTAEPVPGGLLGILPPEFLPEPLKKLFEEFIINKGPTGVTATTELVGEVKINENNLLNLEGPTLTLPVRVHLGNAFLGEDCVIGSSTHPITLKLTDGKTNPPAPNKPIEGSIGEIELNTGLTLLRITKNSLVDNEFSAPTAEGCVNYVPWWLGGEIIKKLANEVIDGKIGLPATSGHNTARLNNTIEKGLTEAVKASE